MLKKIYVSELKVGMFFARVEGSWLEHGLWRGSFIISDAAKLTAVVSSGVKECWIDLSKGRDVDVPKRPESPPEPPVSIAAESPPPLNANVRTGRPTTRSLSVEEEFSSASKICLDARKAVADVYSDIRLGRTPALQAARPVVEEIAASVARRSGVMLAMARLKTKDDYTYLHSVSVCILMVSLGREVGLDPSQCLVAGFAGLLHDVGKALIPLDILNKPDKLTDDEFAQVKAHPAQGHELLLNSGLGDAAVLDVCLHHHEKVNGQGYPDGLSESALSPMAKMGAVCDVYDAVTSDRPYKSAWDPSVALGAMASWQGHFDRHTLAAFIRAVGVYPVGSLVRLSSGKLALVMENRPAQIRAPLVKVFYSVKAKEPVVPYMLDLSANGGKDNIVGVESREAWNFGNLDRLYP